MFSLNHNTNHSSLENGLQLLVLQKYGKARNIQKKINTMHAESQLCCGYSP